MRYELYMSKLLVKRSALVLPPHLVNLNKQSDRLESSSFPHCQATHFWNGSRPSSRHNIFSRIFQSLGSDRFCLTTKNQTISDDTNWQKKPVTMSLVPSALRFAS